MPKRTHKLIVSPCSTRCFGVTSKVLAPVPPWLDVSSNHSCHVRLRLWHFVPLISRYFSVAQLSPLAKTPFQHHRNHLGREQWIIPFSTPFDYQTTRPVHDLSHRASRNIMNAMPMPLSSRASLNIAAVGRSGTWAPNVRRILRQNVRSATALITWTVVLPARRVRMIFLLFIAVHRVTTPLSRPFLREVLALKVIERIEADCRAAVANRPVCANSTWDMYLLSKNKYFCCPKTYFGVLPASGSAGLCEPNVSGIPATRVASLVTAPTSGGGTPSGGNSGSGGSNGEGSGGGGGNSQGTAGGSGTGAGSGSSIEGGSSSGSGISAGAIAGIVIGGIILLAIVVSAILWYHRRSLRRAPPAAKTEPPSDWGVNGSGTGSGQHQTPMAQASSPASTPMPPPQYQYAPPPNQPEVGGTQIVEMPGSRS